MMLQLPGGVISIEELKRVYDELELDEPFDPENQLVMQMLHIQIKHQTRRGRRQCHHK